MRACVVGMQYLPSNFLVEMTSPLPPAVPPASSTGDVDVSVSATHVDRPLISLANESPAAAALRLPPKLAYSAPPPPFDEHGEGASAQLPANIDTAPSTASTGSSSLPPPLPPLP